MNEQFLVTLKEWMLFAQIQYTWIENDVIEIDGFGKLFVFDSDACDPLFSIREKKKEVEMLLNIPVPIAELIDDGIFYAIVKWGSGFYYIDLREEIDLKPLKHIGKCVLNDEYEFVNLGVHTPFELLNGSFLPNQWVQKAKFYGQNAIGICDYHTMAGTLPMQKACAKDNIKAIFGYSLDVRIAKQPRLTHQEFMEKYDGFNDPMGDVNFDQYCSEIGEDGIEAVAFGGKIYCLTDDGLSNMLRVQKHIMVDNVDDPHIDYDELLFRGAGNCFVFDKFSASKITDEILEDIQKAFDQVYFQWDMSEYKADRFDHEVLMSGDIYLKKWHNKLPAVLICDNYYLDATDAKNKIILNKIAHGAAHQQSSDQYFKHISEIISSLDPLFGATDNRSTASTSYSSFLKEITANTVKIANSAHAKFETGVVFMPEYEMTPKQVELYGDRRNMFSELINDGLQKKISIDLHPEYIERIKKEQYVIEASNNIDYFLILWDIVVAAKNDHIQTGIGRGSAGGSLIAFLMDITTINPMEYDLIFERFLTPERCGLVPQDVAVLGDKINIATGDEYVDIVTENGNLKIFKDAELRVIRDEEIIDVFADELMDGDDILFDQRDEVWNIGKE